MQYNSTNYSHHAAQYIPRTDLFYNCKFVPFGPFIHLLTIFIGSQSQLAFELNSPLPLEEVAGVAAHLPQREHRQKSSLFFLRFFWVSPRKAWIEGTRLGKSTSHTCD